MWFRRKPRNRRLGREFVLDVKLRSSQVRAARTRMAAVAIGVVFATVLGSYLLWCLGQWGLNRLVYENKAFAIQELDMQTDGDIAVDQLRRWSRVRLGDNLMALDLARVKRDLEMVSVVATASVERILPHTLRVRVTEREPLAQLTVPRPRAAGGIEMAVFYLDPDGYVMLPLEPGQRATPEPAGGEPLPTIFVPNANEVQVGRTNESPQLKAALRLLVAFNHSPIAGLVDLKRIDINCPGILVVATGQGSKVTFGLTGPERQLRRWQQIAEAGQRWGKAIDTLDLAVSNNIPATWLEASAVPPATAKPPKIPKRKHV